MATELSPSSPRPRTCEYKLFVTCLDACIQGIQGLEVDKQDKSSGMSPPLSPAVCLPNKISLRASAAPRQDINSPCPSKLTCRSNKQALHISSPDVLPSSPLLLRSLTDGQDLHFLDHSAALNPIMNRSPSYGGPPTGPRGGRGGSLLSSRYAPAQPATVTMPTNSKNTDSKPVDSMRASSNPILVNQVIPANVAVHPAPEAGKIKLKKNTLKVVKTAGPLPATSPKSVPVSTTSTPSVSTPILEVTKEIEA